MHPGDSHKVNFRQSEMRAAQQREGCARQPRLGHGLGKNAVELAIIESCIWSDKKASAE